MDSLVNVRNWLLMRTRGPSPGNSLHTHFTMGLNHKPKRWMFIVLCLIAGPFLVLLGIYGIVSINSVGRTYEDVSSIPTREYCLLLATSPITPQGGHNFYFDNRLKAAVELYKAGKIKTIIVSGGDYTGQHDGNGCNEPVAIQDSLMAHGVLGLDIVLDFEGQRTLKSIVKVKERYGVDSITIISQQFHNERALWQADHIGIDAIAYNAYPSHIKQSRIKNTVRELFARVKLLIDLALGEDDKIAEEIHKNYDGGIIPGLPYLNNTKGERQNAEGYGYIGKFNGVDIDTLYFEGKPMYFDGTEAIDYGDGPLPDDYEFPDYYQTIITLSDKSVPPLIIDFEIGEFIYEGDLDGNGTEEIAILSGGINSNCRGYYIYTLDNGQWKYLIEPMSTAYNLRESGLDLAQPAGRKGEFRLRYSDMDSGCCSYAPIKDEVVKVNIITEEDYYKYLEEKYK